MATSTDFDDWYAENYARVLVAVALVLGPDRDRAEDATNEAFVQAFADWESVSRMDSPNGWVTKVAINRARRFLRRRARGIELLNQQRVETAAHDRHVDLDLWSALDVLSFRQRKAIVLRYVEGLSQAEVASELEIAPGTAAATLSQARGVLKAELQKGDPS